MDGTYDHVVAEFNAKLSEINNGTLISLKNINKGILLCNDALYHLKTIVEKKGFKNTEDEIRFFKRIKVEPLSLLVYFNEVRSCQLHMPRLGSRNKLAFLNKKMRRVNKFFHRYSDFVHYMDQDLCYLDKQYFTRSHQVFPLYALPESSYLDPKFFTSHDMLWARIKGMNHFTLYIRSLIKEIKQKNKANHSNQTRLKPIKWTASKIALTELLYAIHETQVINNGTDDLKTMAHLFEQLFGVQLGNIYKTYSEIKARKGNRARFLEELTERFNHKMDQDDAI
ncbi:RteC domain-containing protein [Aestuariibaculum sediminum]|uniref:RteC domain-containing protein n=1 Tax=Aestuariibaculum sediminum TaxID=2770637 RepID=A0A8J6U8G4_9FLAO|nr:RteC domain-containing protein [Aestuariibaculum sediminum]MBD0831512.1 RteC domain-containing protein [Aestuariibaculum sediminum]